MRESLPLPSILPIPPGVVAPGDYEALARLRLDEGVAAYFDGGAGGERSLRSNREAWEALRLWPRVLRSLAGGGCQTELLGRPLALPVLLAPVPFQRMAHPDGEIATAFAAAAQGAGLVASTLASVPLELIAPAARHDSEHGPLWFQLEFQHERELSLELVRRAELAGFDALVLSVDQPCEGLFDRERRAAFSLPSGVFAANLEGMPLAPAVAVPPDGSPLFDARLSFAPTWEDVAWLSSRTRLPLVLKGILHPADARIAVDHGVAAVIVSNQGGRTLDGVVATASALPAVVRAVQGRIPVLVDGGIRRGADILKALALGASAVLVGRPQVHALATAGTTGVAHLLRLLRNELEVAMAQCGCARLADIDASLLDPGAWI